MLSDKPHFLIITYSNGIDLSMKCISYLHAMCEYRRFLKKTGKVFSYRIEPIVETVQLSLF